MERLIPNHDNYYEMGTIIGSTSDSKLFITSCALRFCQRLFLYLYKKNADNKAGRSKSKIKVGYVTPYIISYLSVKVPLKVKVHSPFHRLTGTNRQKVENS